MSIYCEYGVFKYVEDYIKSINTEFHFDIKQYNGNSLNEPLEKIIIFIQKFPVNLNWDLVNKNTKFFMVNIEQMSRDYAYNLYTHNFESFRQLCFKNYINNIPIWLDYNESNFEYIKSYNFITKELPYIPYEEEITKLKSYSKNKEYDIGFIDSFGSVKRNKIIKDLIDRGYKMNIITGWNEERDIEIGKCKILINIHYQDDFKIFENIRCDRWLYSGLKVLSEVSINNRNFKPLLMEVDYENLVDSVADFLNLDVILDKDFLDDEIVRIKNKVHLVIDSMKY